MAVVLLTMRAAGACRDDRKAHANLEKLGFQPVAFRRTGKSLPLSGNLWPALNGRICRSFLRLKEFAQWTCPP